MNKLQHLCCSLFLLVVAETLFLTMLLLDYGTLSVLHAGMWSIIFFLLGVIAPDFDHRKVQMKYRIIEFFKYFTKHRGHMHSILAALIYGGLIFLITFSFVKYWYFPVGCGIFGYFSHLFEDWLVEAKHARTAMKWW